MTNKVVAFMVCIGIGISQMLVAEEPTTLNASEYFESVSAQILPGASGWKYRVVVKLRKPINDNKEWYAVIEYENPEDSSSPVIAYEEYDENDTSITLNSKIVGMVSAIKEYQVILKGYKDSNHTALIARHEQGVKYAPTKMDRELTSALNKTSQDVLLGQKLPIPNNSFLMQHIAGTDPLGTEIYTTFKVLMTDRYKCPIVDIIKVVSYAKAKDITISNIGQVTKGRISEKWYVRMCEKQRIFIIEISPNPKGGNNIRIVEAQ